MITRLLFTALVLLLPASSWAAITFDSVNDSSATQSVSSITKSVVVNAGTDRILAVCAAGSRGAAAGPKVTGVTFNGTETFTLAREDTRDIGTHTWNTAIWYLVNPTVTTANVVVTWAGSTNNRAQGFSAVQLNGVSQTSTVDSSAGANGSGANASVIITTVADGAFIVDCPMSSVDAGLTVGAGQTMRTDRVGGTFNEAFGVSTVAKATAGAETMDWTSADSGANWVTTAVSFAPSGGADPAPAVNGQVTVTWTNGNDPGSNASGIFNTTTRRCTGTGCACPTTGPGIGSVLYPTTTFVDTTVQPNTTYGYCEFHTDVAGNASINSGVAYVTTSATPPDPLPTIASAVFDNDGVTITPGAVTPTKVKIWTFTSLGIVSSVEYTWASLTAGRHDEVWIDGLKGGCVSAIDANGIENTVTSAYQCTDFTIQNPLFVEPFDTTPPVITCAAIGDLPAGTTEWPFSCQVDKVSSGKYDTTDVAFASMTNSLALNSLTFSGTVTGLTDGSTTTLYLRAQITGLNDDVYPALTSEVLTIHVDEETADTTPPGDVANLVCTIIGNAASCTWDAASDAVSYQMFQGDGACPTFAPAGSPVATTNLQLGLSFGTTYCWKVKALDAVNNFSTNFSNTQTKTTLAQPDIEPPSDLEGLRVDVFTNSVRASWILGSDNIGPVSVNLEYCQAEVGQTDCANFNVNISKIGQSFLTLNLSPGRWYCFRGKNSDGAGNVSVNYSAAVCAMTATTGLGAPRTEIPFGVTRLPLALPRLPNATTRIPVP